MSTAAPNRNFRKQKMEKNDAEVVDYEINCLGYGRREASSLPTIKLARPIPVGLCAHCGSVYQISSMTPAEVEDQYDTFPSLCQQAMAVDIKCYFTDVCVSWSSIPANSWASHFVRLWNTSVLDSEIAWRVPTWKRGNPLTMRVDHKPAEYGRIVSSSKACETEICGQHCQWGI